jgi:hypothetical protein
MHSASSCPSNPFHSGQEASPAGTMFQCNIPQLVRYTVNQPRTVGMLLDYHF